DEEFAAEALHHGGQARTARPRNGNSPIRSSGFGVRAVSAPIWVPKPPHNMTACRIMLARPDLHVQALPGGTSIPRPGCPAESDFVFLGLGHSSFPAMVRSGRAVFRGTATLHSRGPVRQTAWQRSRASSRCKF